ncbi:MAG: hypothetical protein CM1200mP20_08550 [Pseudomonadota bacterium]|nr:MAG: hypothetical protein CM1200mP20_08550 [Pseudomonadota bacterium]
MKSEPNSTASSATSFRGHGYVSEAIHLFGLKEPRIVKVFQKHLRTVESPEQQSSITKVGVP